MGKIGQEYLSKDIEAGRLEDKKAEYAKESPSKKTKSPIQTAIQRGKKSPFEKAKLTPRNKKAEPSTAVQEKKKNVPAKEAGKKGNPLAGVTYAASNIRSEMLAIPNGHIEPAKNKNKNSQQPKKGASKPAKENKSNAAKDNKTEAEIAQFKKEIEQFKKEKQK